MLAADTLEALGIKRGDYVIKVNNRKVLDGLREVVGLAGPENDAKWLTAMRALDKLDRLGDRGVRELLGKGRKDESGDFTPGAMLSDAAIDRILSFTGWGEQGSSSASSDNNVTVTLANFETAVSGSAAGREGTDDLKMLAELIEASGYGADRIRIDPSVIRGLEYYTGPVFEAELTFEVKDEKGRPVRFGSVGGGGRYDDLVARFTGQKVPATGFSIGVSRLQAALAALDKDKATTARRPRHRHGHGEGAHRRLPEDGAGAAQQPASAPSSTSAIRRSSASSSNTPTSAIRPASSSRAQTRRRTAR